MGVWQKQADLGWSGCDGRSCDVVLMLLPPPSKLHRRWLREENLVRVRLRLWAKIHLEVTHLKVQIIKPQPRLQGDDDDRENQPLGWEQRLGLTQKFIENIWIRI